MTRRRRTDPIDRPPTPRQQQALDIMAQGIRRGRPPTLRELCTTMGIRSTNGVVCLLRPLVRKGYLAHDPDSPARLSYRLTERRPPLSVAWLVDQAEQLLAAIDQHYGRAELLSDLACSTPWWRLVVRTGGWGENEAAIAAVDPTWHALTLQAQVRGGLWVWAWGPVPEQLGGELGPVRVDEQPAVRKRLIDPATVGAGCSGGHPEWRTCERCRP